MCHRYEIHIAAVDAEQGIIYANPSCGFSEKWILFSRMNISHAGLQHQKRCNGRDFFLWNIACDYVINDWLHEMEIGRMPPDGLLYDETLHNKSAESIYDLIVKDPKVQNETPSRALAEVICLTETDRILLEEKTGSAWMNC